MLAVLTAPLRTCWSLESMLETSGTTRRVMWLSEAMRGVTVRMVPRLVYWMLAPAGELADPGVTWKIGKARVTESVAVWLSSMTARGVEITSVSVSLLKNERTALRPSASRNAVAGLKPLAVSTRIRGGPETRLFGVLDTVLLPNWNFWFSNVPDQSMPLTVEGLREVSSRRASMSTCLVGESSRLIRVTALSISLSVVVTIRLAVRGSASTELRGDRVDLTMVTRLLASA